MCKPKPGPRCFTDSRKTLATAEKRVNVLREKQAEASAALDRALKSGATQEIRKIRTRLATIESSLVQREREVVHAQRDIDGTSKGQKALEALITSSRDPKEVRVLMNRYNAAQGLRASRVHALERLNSGSPAPINLVRKPVAA